MAEIKSTLDLIMERTKHLTLSPEEKELLRRKELKTSIGVLVQKYLDGAESLPQVVERLKNISKEESTPLIWEEIVSRLDFRESNDALFELIKEMWPQHLAFLFNQSQSFKEKLSQLRSKRRAEALAELARSGISGSALEPNLEREEEWKRDTEKLLNLFREELKAFPQMN
ncbi:MAG: hypothetical protein N2572_07355 [Syntrophales bacterium]|nr:hypothetical protein [Syntrophales bacterium]